MRQILIQVQIGSLERYSSGCGIYFSIVQVNRDKKEIRDIGQDDSAESLIGEMLS